MTSRELHRLFQQVLKAAVPIVGLSGCGDMSPNGRHRLTPAEDPVLMQQDSETIAYVLECTSDAWNQAKNDANLKLSPLSLVTLRDIASAATTPLQKLPQNPAYATCVELCGGNNRFVEAVLRLTTGMKIGIVVKVGVNDCEVYTELQPTRVACAETWTWQVVCNSASVGRRPEGFVPALSHMMGDIGAYLALIAQLEAASVPAFERLQRELIAHDAPAAFIDRTAQFADDEVKHTRMASALAHRYGGTPRFDPLPFLDVRPLDEVLVENAIEGCVRETFGALIAHRQARHAEDPIVRSAMEIIAEDETRHAAFSWEIETWARDRLTRSAQRRVDEARAAAMHELLSEESNPSASAQRLLGLPTSAETRALAAGLRDQLLS